MVTRHVCKTSVLAMLTQNKHFDVNLQCIYFSYKWICDKIQSLL